jgi:hypothetical protein
VSDIVDDDVMVVLSLLRGTREGFARFIIVALGSSSTAMTMVGRDDESMADDDSDAAVAAVADFPVAAKCITLMDGCSLRVVFIRPGDGTVTCWVGCLGSALPAAAVEFVGFRRRKAEEICFMVEVVEVE